MCRDRGFTLIELLVVIAIIALLVSILLPSIQKAKALGQRVKCQAHLRHLAIAWQTYASENDGWMVKGIPTSGDVKGEPDPEDGFVESGPGIEPIKNGRLWPYCGGNVDIWRCPSDPQGLARSFAIIGPMRGEVWWRRPYQRAGHPGDTLGTTRVGRIVNTSLQLVYMEESDPRGYNVGSWMMNVTEKQWWRWIDNVALHHGHMANIGLADGHAELLEWEDEDTIAHSKSGEFGWTDPDNPDWLKLRQRYRQLPAAEGMPRLH